MIGRTIDLMLDGQEWEIVGETAWSSQYVTLRHGGAEIVRPRGVVWRALEIDDAATSHALPSSGRLFD